MTNRYRLLRVFTGSVLSYLCFMGTACSSTVSMQQWQKGLEQHMVEHSHSDSSFLRDSGDDSQSRFAVIGAPLPEKSTDISGALLGRQKIIGTDWLVFIVAASKAGEVEDIRVALYADDGSPSRWIISEPNEEALSSYERAKESQWRRFNTVRTERPFSPGLFPPEEDRFRLDIAGNTVSVVEESCGARWTVVVN